ncbi:MAG: M24 family metallopeptidase [Desulfomonilaceae bacterium]
MSVKDPIVLIREKLKRLKYDAVLLNTSEITRSANVRYLSGFTGSDAALLISQNRLDLFTDGRYKTQSKNECTGFQIHVTRNKISSIVKLLRRLGVNHLGIEGTRISFDFVAALKRAAKEVSVFPLKNKDLVDLRLFKNGPEVDAIRSAAHIASSTCVGLLGLGIEGKSESDLAGQMELLFKKAGASSESFETIVASGTRSALPHGSPTGKIIQSGDLVVIDFGCIVSGYCSDETVTCVVGRASEEQSNIHSAVKEAHDRAIESLKPGVKAKDVDGIARESITKAGYGKYFMHSLGHGVGLEVHEPPYLSPRSDGVLDAGMVFTIEPGIYIEGFGGVRLESLVYLSSSGPEVLSEAPKTLISVG